MKNKQRTYALAKMEMMEPSISHRERASAAVEQDTLLEFAMENKQEDLQYFKAVYATCGFNLNDDVFVKDEFWAARKSPVLKPTNWQHKDKDIIGVIYGVEAQYLDGTSIDMESEKIPEEDFELIVYGVIYKYTFAERAAEIEKRSEDGDLYVSMETWFSDFAYALLDEEKSEMSVVERNSGTAGLDAYLRCAGGVGKYNGKRIGRVLKGMTFGGMGIVDQPANPRSGGVVHASEDGTDNNENVLETINMEDIKGAVKAELAEVAKAEAHEQAIAKVDELVKQNATAAENLERAAERAERAEEANKAAEAILAVLDTKADSAIANIENLEALEGEVTVEDKLDSILTWATTNVKQDESEELVALKAELEELRTFKAEIDEAKAEAIKAERTETRTADVKELLGEDAEEETLESVLAKVVDLDEEAYAEKIEEWKVFAAKSRPTIMHDGGQGSPDEEGASGESKAKSGPRENVKISASLEDAEVEEHIEPTEEVVEDKQLGLASVLLKNKKNKE